MKTEWQKVHCMTSTNYVLEAEDFYISYNPDLGTITGFFDSDDGGPETALVHKNPREFLILNGDYRDSYEKLFPQGYEACKKFYLQQSAHARSSWSEDESKVGNT